MTMSLTVIMQDEAIRSASEGLGIKNPDDVCRIIRISHIPTISVTGIYLLIAALSTICKGKPAIFSRLDIKPL